MAMFVRKRQESDFLRGFGGGELPATLGESVEAAAGDPTLLPTGMLLEIAEEKRADPRIGNIVSRGPASGRVQPTEEVVDLMTPDQIKEEYPDLGMENDEPTPRAVVEIQARRKREEIIRNDLLQRGPGGFVAGATRLGAQFLTAAIDPINIASAFIPVVSTARGAALAARLGATRGRAAVGVIEGTVGAAVVEPFVFLGARELDLDYDMSDALTNVAFGGVLGGGLHVAGGAIASKLRGSAEFKAAQVAANVNEQWAIQPEATIGARPETLEAAVKTSVAQFVSGKDVDVTPHFAVEGRLQQPIRAGVGDVPTEPQITPEITASINAQADEFVTAFRKLDDLERKVKGDFIDGPGARDAFRTEDGKFDRTAATENISARVEQAIAAGEDVRFYRNGTPSDVVGVENGRLVTDTGDKFGLTSLFTGKDAKNRIEIGAATPEDATIRATKADAQRLGIDPRLDDARIREIIKQDRLAAIPRSRPNARQNAEAFNAESVAIERTAKATHSFETQQLLDQPAPPPIQEENLSAGIDEQIEFFRREEGLTQSQLAELDEADAILSDNENMQAAIHQAGACLIGRA